MNAFTAAILIVLLLVVCLGSRRWALLAVMAGVFFLTQWHSVDVFGLNFYPMRFLEAAAFGRVLLRRELTRARLNRIDWALLLLYNYTAVVWILRSSDFTPRQFATALDPTVCYLALRSLILDVDDLRWVLNALVVILVPYTALVLVERMTGRTAFGFAGAAQELYFRNGIPRCQGSFRHAVLLGAVAASFLSLYIGLWLGGTRRAVAVLGGALCLTLVVLSNSGGPVTAAAAVFLGWSVWPWRERMARVRRAALALLLLLVLLMKAPIWYLPFKVSGVVGGGGFYRGLLLERAWQDLGKWWLFGMDIQETASWTPVYVDVVGGVDVTNQFLVFGVRGGLVGILLSVGLLWFAFRGIGMALASQRGPENESRASALVLWGLGVALVVHSVSWLGTSYFDQSYVIWLLHVAAVSSLVQAARHPAFEPAGASLAKGRLRPPTLYAGAPVGAGTRDGRLLRPPDGCSKPLRTERHLGPWQKY